MNRHLVLAGGTVVLGLSLMSLKVGARAPEGGLPLREDARLLPFASSNRLWNGVATTAQGRIFVSYPSSDGPGVQAAEILADGTTRPYPDEAWNTWREGRGTQAAFVNVNAVRIGPDGHLWVVDGGAPGIGKPAVEGGGRLLVFDLATNSLLRVHDLAAALKPRSYVDDIRFNGPMVYVTDAGEPGLIVLDTRSGVVRRVLDGHPTTVDRRPMRADGVVLRTEEGAALKIHADQLEVSPDGRWLYYQPSSGPLARVETRLLDDPAAPPEQLARAAAAWVDTPTTGGTAIDADGVIYLSDPDRRRILKIRPDRRIEVLIADPRLVWSDAMWIDRDGWLWIPATQQNLAPGFNGGIRAIRYPVWLYRMRIGAGPAPNDHG